MKYSLILATVFFFNTSALPDLDKNNIEETHLFLEEKGVLVDEKLTRDLKNEIVSIHVPAYHDRSELNIVYDENSVSFSYILKL